MKKKYQDILLVGSKFASLINNLASVKQFLNDQSEIFYTAELMLSRLQDIEVKRLCA